MATHFLPLSKNVSCTSTPQGKHLCQISWELVKNWGSSSRRQIFPPIFAIICRYHGNTLSTTFKKCVLHIYTPRQTSVPNLFFTNSHEIWHRCLPWGVDVQDTFFDSGRKCVAMVTAYYGKNWGKILRRELLPQFFTNSHEIWHRCLPWGVDVQDTFFESGRKCVAMVTAYYGKNWGKNLASRTTSSVFHQFSWIWHRCLPLGVDVQDTFLDSGRKCVAMVTAYYGKNWGKSCVANYFLSFSPILIKFGTDVCLWV